MLTQRLSLALDRKVVSLPESGKIAVVSPDASTDLSALPRERTEVVSRSHRVHRAFIESGFHVVAVPEGPYTMAILSLPRAKAAARAALAEIVPITRGPTVIDGQKADGVESLQRELGQRAALGDVLVKAHGRLFSATNVDCTGWNAVPDQVTRPKGGTYQTPPGAFSCDGIDPGSRALADALPDRMDGHVIDLGSGWGYLADAVLERAGVASVDLVEDDLAALEASRANLDDVRARFHWANALTFRPDPFADHVVTNPPFHAGRSPDVTIGQGFIRAGARMLTRKGTLWLVANRRLPYEKTLVEFFRDVRTLGQPAEYKLFKATQPRPVRKR
ncbi:MAG: methyltransferase [Boseongicola sp.]|nr:methyltransferase [Boseongicola sp.]